MTRTLDVDEHRQAYLEALMARDVGAARGAVDAALALGTPVEEIYLGVLQPALYEIGRAWAVGDFSVADEHSATAVTQSVLGMLGPRMRTTPKDGRLAVVTGSPEERHALGVQMVADFLEGDGWEVLNLGASTPARDLARMADAERPDVVALSTATPAGLPGAAEAVHGAARARPAAARGARRPAVGGPGARRRAHAWAPISWSTARASWSHCCGSASRRRPPRRRSAGSSLRVVRNPRRTALFALAVIAIVAVAALVAREDRLPGGVPAVPTPPDARNDREATPLPDPFAYDDDRKDEFEQRAAAGSAHVLYARSPGGAGATAQRVAHWRPQIEAAAAEANVPPDELEALVFLESAGREDAMAGNTEGAVGLTQILAETGQNLLGMRVDVPRSRRYTRRIRRALLRGRLLEVERLRAARRQGRPALRPRPGAGRHRALPQARQGALPPRRHGVRLLPHGDGQPRERPARLRGGARRRGRLLHAGLLRLDAASATPPPSASSPPSATTPPTTCGSSARRAGSCACPQGRGRAGPPAGRADRQGVGRGGAAPARLDSRASRPPRSCSRPGTTRTSWSSRTTRA